MAFENSFYCQDYITEKFFRNGLLNYAIPVVKGARKENYLNHNIQNSAFLYVDDYKSVKSLVNYMLYLHENQNEHNKYHKWGSEYEIRVKYDHWCELCNKLHTDHKPKVYENFQEWYNSCKNFYI